MGLFFAVSGRYISERRTTSNLECIMHNKKRKVVGVMLLCICITIFIFYNSLQDIYTSKEQSKRISEVVQSILDPDQTISAESFHFVVRKAAHMIEFAVLGVFCTGGIWLFSNANRRGNIHTLFEPLFIVLLIAVIDEYIQSFLDRTSSVSDILLDFFGGSIGIAVVCMIKIIYNKIKNKEKRWRK